MRCNSRAWLYSEKHLRQLRSNIHFAPISGQYKRLIRNMIKLLALHDIVDEGHGTFINTKDVKGNPRNHQRGRPVERPQTEGFAPGPRGRIFYPDEAGPQETIRQQTLQHQEASSLMQQYRAQAQQSVEEEQMSGLGQMVNRMRNSDVRS